MRDEVRETLREAIGIMTAWLDEPDGGDFLPSVLRARLAEDGLDGIVKILHGLISLNGVLLTELLAATDVDEQATLRRLALELGAE